MNELRHCPACDTDQELRCFNDTKAECFRCRTANITVSFGAGGKAGKQMFHDVTTKEFREETFKKARANGLDPIPAVSSNFYGGVR
jgi:hypothetical protein